MENLVLTRIDDRLIHGQVMTAWIKNKKATQVVIADDQVAEDEYMIEVLEMAIPEDIAIGIFSKEDTVTFLSQGLDEPTILLVKGPEVLNYLVDHGIEIDEVDVGGMGAGNDRSVLYKNISTSEKENEEFRKLLNKNVNVFIPSDSVKQIFEIFRKMDFVPNVFSQHGRISFLSKEGLEDYTRNVMIPSMQISHPDFVYTDQDLQDLMGRVIFIDSEEALFQSDHQVLKVTTHCPQTERLAELREALKDVPDLAVANTSVADIEITSIHAQKGIGLMDYAKTKGYQADEIVAIGDSGNDYSMLSLPGIHSVAMANATEEIQNVCVYRTRDNANDGIAYIIRCILADRNNFELR